MMVPASSACFAVFRTPLSYLSVVAFFGASAWACGGKVTVEEDAAGGAGTGASSTGGTGASSTGGTGASSTGGTGATGSGGTGNVGAGTSTGTDTGTGVCDCDLFCETILDCGFEPPGGCDSICNQVPQQAKDCVCEADSCQQIAQDCFQGGPGGGGGGPGGGQLQVCFECINDIGVFGCEPAIDQCLSNPSCETLIDCNSQCGWTPQCAGQCAAMNPAGAIDFANLMGCVSCGSCLGECGQTPLGNYCLDG